MEDKTSFEQFRQVLSQTAVVLKELTHIEQQKADVASQKQHQLMDGFLKEEQALMLRLRGLEQHRMKLSEDLGFQDLTFRQILEQADNTVREELTPLFTSMTEETARLTQAKDAADRIIRLRLREMELAISKERGINYESNGNITEKMPAHFQNTYV